MRQQLGNPGRPTRRSAALLFAMSIAAVAGNVRADLLAEINEARAAGCGGKPGARAPLRSSAKLNDIARRLQRGESLKTAMAAEDYRPLISTSVHMSGWLTESLVVRNLTRRFCNLLVDPRMRELGVARKGRDMQLVVAQPFAAPSLNDAAAVSRRVLALTNIARARGQRCGEESYPAANPVMLSDTLREAALAHSRDMAQHDYFDHKGRDGSQPAERVTRQGYRWRVVGENLAAGIVTAEDAVQGWLDSPHHCANLMDPRFTQMGVAYAIDTSSSMAIYWTQVFALPRD
jgi:uncharacterized protein YkwD